MADSLGEWRWTSINQRLKLDLHSEKHASALKGEWGISEFGLLLNGLSRRQFKRVFKEPAGIVSCALIMADGLTVHMVGAFDENSDAQGLLLTETVVQEANNGPGPDLVPVFQPIISLQTGKPAGFEALARWPTEFEGSEGGERISDDALASNMMIHACQALATWREIEGCENLFVQVNLTARDLTDEKLVELVEALIGGYGLTSGAMRLELTEQAALRDVEQAVKIANQLKEVGAALVLDDFGTGHSSFLWLAQLPADSLKIDYDLISQLDDGRVRTILEALTLLARRLNMRTTAEGVEDRSQLVILQDIGFDYAQGFALGRPMSVQSATDFLRDAF